MIFLEENTNSSKRTNIIENVRALLVAQLSSAEAQHANPTARWWKCDLMWKVLFLTQRQHNYMHLHPEYGWSAGGRLQAVLLLLMWSVVCWTEVMGTRETTRTIRTSSWVSDFKIQTYLFTVIFLKIFIAHKQLTFINIAIP